MRWPPATATGVLVALLTAFAAWPTLDYGFVYDDVAVVVERPPFWEEGIAGFARSRHWGTGRHATLASLDLDRLWQGTVPGPFHRTNLALAAALSVLVFVLARRVGLGEPGAAAAAALYAVHPTHVDAVASIVGRAELLAALSVVGSVLLATGAGGGAPPGRGRVALGVFALASLGIHAKESAASLLLLLPLARFCLGPRVALLPALGGATLAAASLATLRLAFPAEIVTPEYVDNPLAYEPWFERIPKALAILASYAALGVWPWPLLPDRSFAATDPSLALGLLATLAWSALATASLLLVRRAPPTAFALLWFPASFAVTANVAMPIGTVMAERFLLLPTVGTCLLAGLLADRAWRRRVGPAATCLAVAFAVVSMLALFRERAAPWRSPEAYHAASASASPRSAKAAYDHGAWLLGQGRRKEAEGEFSRALAIHPAFSRAAFHLAESRAARGDAAGGAGVYETYLAASPTDTGALANVTRLALQAGDPAAARAWASRWVETAPDDPAAIEALVLTERAVARAAAAKPPLSP